MYDQPKNAFLNRFKIDCHLAAKLLIKLTNQMQLFIGTKMSQIMPQIMQAFNLRGHIHYHHLGLQTLQEDHPGKIPKIQPHIKLQ